MHRNRLILFAALYGLLAVVIFIIAASVITGSVRRWGAASALADMDAKFLDRNLAAARSAAQSAAMWLGSDARSALPGATDPSALKRIRGGAGFRERKAIDDAISFLNLQRNSGEFIETGTPSGELLAFVNNLRRAIDRDAVPAWPSLSGAPDWNVQIFALEEAIIHGLRLGDSVLVRDSAERLLLAEPRHPAAGPLEVIAGYMQPAANFDAILNGIRNQEDRFSALRLAGSLANADPRGMRDGEDALAKRQELAAKAVPFSKRTEAEQAVAVFYGDQSPSELQNLADKSKSQTIKTMVAIRLIQAGELTAVKLLASELDESIRVPLLKTVAIREFDVETLLELGGERDLLPRVTNLRFGFDEVSFFLVNREGIGSAVPVSFLIDGEPVQAARVINFGSLYTIKIRQGRPNIRLAVVVDGEALESEVFER